MSTSAEVVLARLKAQANPDNVEGMAHFGINPENTLGLSIPTLRAMAKEIGRDHDLAEELWASGIHEARLLAGFIDNPKQVSEAQMEAWVKDFDSWDVCDQVCMNLFDRTPFTDQKAVEWSSREEEFVKRAAFALMASLAVHDKKSGDERFETFFPLIVQQAVDERNYVRKAVNWALRQIGKRNSRLNRRSIEVAEQIAQLDSKSARWIAADALKELTSPAVQGKVSLKGT
jgi:3-methyladenine DNA glycosylase AlkD